mgnify:CR=1 FL=1
MANDYVDTIDLDGTQWEIHDTDLRATLLDTIYPIGVTYVQYPQQASPQTLFPTMTWQVLDYSGAFFRASGGNANSFIESGQTLTAQAQATAKNGLTITKSGSISVNSAGVSTCRDFYADTSPSIRLGSTSYYGATGTAYSHSHTVTNTLNYTLSSSQTETRPINYTIKIWVRTA